MLTDFAGLEQRCREKLAAGGDAAHDLAHIERVVRNAQALAATEGARLEVVLPAAWLHDCVTVPKDSPQRAAASRRAAAQAVVWLCEWGWPEVLRPEIAHAIEAHSFTAGITPTTIEAKVVQDADRLDALGGGGAGALPDARRGDGPGRCMRRWILGASNVRPTTGRPAPITFSPSC